MENQQQQPQNTPLCRANCGFYGSPATEDLCSKCFKDMIARKQETGNAQRHSPISATEETNTNGDGGVSIPPAASTSLDKSTDVDNNAKTAENSGTDTAFEQQSSIASLAEQTKKEARAEKPKNRCHVCNKRVGLTGFECRCGGLYCGEHRYDTAHGCTFDYKTTGRDELRKNNPQVISEKIQRI